MLKKRELNKIISVIVAVALVLSFTVMTPSVLLADTGSIWTTNQSGIEQDGNVNYVGLDSVYFRGDNFTSGDTLYVKVEALAGAKTEWFGTKTITIGSDGLIPNTQLISIVPFEAGANEYQVAVCEDEAFKGQVKHDNFKVKNPQIAIVKEASPTNLSPLGGDVTYTYTVTNPGNVPLSDVNIKDDNGTPSNSGDDFVIATKDSGDTNNDGKLDMDETWIFTHTTTITKDTTNIATASGTYSGATVTATDDATVELTAADPNIMIDKYPDKDSFTSGGGSVTYTYKVTNTGNVPLSNVGVRDDNGTSGSGNTGDDFDADYQSGDANNDGKLDLTETWTYTKIKTITATTRNIATASGTFNQQTVIAEDYALVTVGEITPGPAILLDKTVDKDTLGYGGGLVTYKYTVTNEGNVPLSNVSVKDDNGTSSDSNDDFVINTIESGDTNNDGLLGINETWIFKATRTITTTTTNLATASGTYNSQTVTDEDDATVEVGGQETIPSIQMVKTPSDIYLPYGGGPVTYTYTLMNNGNVPLSSVVVRDDNGTPSNTSDDFNADYYSGDENDNGTFDSDETWIFKATRTIEETTTNIAIASGTYIEQTITARAEATVEVGEPGPGPYIHILKTPSTTSLTRGGGSVTYTYTVTNPGDVSLGQISVRDDNGTSDDTNDDFEATYQSGDANSDGRLGTTETWIFTATKDIKKTTTNIATATGWASEEKKVTDTDSATVTVRTGHHSGTNDEPITAPVEIPVVAPTEQLVPVTVPVEEVVQAPAEELPKTGGNPLAYLLSGSTLAALGVLVRRFLK